MAETVRVEDVRHVASLARLGLTDERAAELARELNTILEHMDVLGRVPTDDVPEFSAASAGMRLRDDHGPPIPLEESAESFVPSMKAGLIQVPRISTHEDAESA